MSIKKKKILIAIPTHDMLPAAFMQSLCRLTEYMLQKKYSVTTRLWEGTLVAKARQSLVRIAIDQGFDYVFFVDSDMILHPETLERLLNDDCDIVSTMFFKRTPPYQPCFYMDVDISQEPLTYSVPISWPDRGLHECAATGLAATLIRTEVFKKVGKNMFIHPTEGLGEDIAFCLNARAMGFTVYVDTRLEAGHIGRVIVNEKMYKEELQK